MTTSLASRQFNNVDSLRVPRRSPKVQELQSASAYVDIYTGSPLSKALETYPESSVHATSLSPHAHPEAFRRWQGPKGFGARHINDSIPFSLWNDNERRFRKPTVLESRQIMEMYNASRLEDGDYLMTIHTPNPPKPVPLTIASMPAIFVPPGYQQSYALGSALYPWHRLPDPRPQLAWGRMRTPSKSQMLGVVSALEELANVQRVYFFTSTIVVELVHGDGREYQPRSLPGRMAGITMTYHHGPSSFLDTMKDHTRERSLDPSRYLSGPRIGPLPQDGTNYLREPQWGSLNPGVRVSTGSSTGSGASAEPVRSTTCGLLIQKGNTKYLTVSNNGFLGESEVFHPAYDGDKIGDIVDRYPQFDIAMVRLTPEFSNRFSNDTYFQAEPPKRLVTAEYLKHGAWFEVDGMSTGLISLAYVGDVMEKPGRPPGHPDIPFLRWRRHCLLRIFGATNPTILDGLCGAPLVEERTGNVAGFFHLANGDFAECAALDDLVAEGWDVV